MKMLSGDIARGLIILFAIVIIFNHVWPMRPF